MVTPESTIVPGFGFIVRFVFFAVESCMVSLVCDNDRNVRMNLLGLSSVHVVEHPFKVATFLLSVPSQIVPLIRRLGR
jgi:hypothetical protein